MDTDTGRGSRPDPPSDLEYDLAHEGQSPQAAPSTADRPREPVHVPTETPEYDGDYGYDLAHDVPGR
jgi:hypothetical protein